MVEGVLCNDFEETEQFNILSNSFELWFPSKLFYLLIKKLFFELLVSKADENILLFGVYKLFLFNCWNFVAL